MPKYTMPVGKSDFAKLRTAGDYTDYDECFGFTSAEMEKLLADTEFIDKQPIFKEWYDGYIFGNREVYCSWDVLNNVMKP